MIIVVHYVFFFFVHIISLKQLNCLYNWNQEAHFLCFNFHVNSAWKASLHHSNGPICQEEELKTRVHRNKCSNRTEIKPNLRVWSIREIIDYFRGQSRKCPKTSVEWNKLRLALKASTVFWEPPPSGNRTHSYWSWAQIQGLLLCVCNTNSQAKKYSLMHLQNASSHSVTLLRSSSRLCMRLLEA